MAQLHNKVHQNIPQLKADYIHFAYKSNSNVLTKVTERAFVLQMIRAMRRVISDMIVRIWVHPCDWLNDFDLITGNDTA